MTHWRTRLKQAFDANQPCKYCWVWSVVILLLVIGLVVYARYAFPEPRGSAKYSVRPTVSRASLPDRGSDKPIQAEPKRKYASAKPLPLEPTWHTAIGSTFGGSGDYQQVAYSPLTTQQLIENNIRFVAMRRPDLARRGIVLRYKGKISYAIILDHGPAVWTRRDIDLGQNVADELGYETDDKLEWRLIEK